MINTDTFLKMGKNHKICQDYIISGSDPFPYIILSDGCSSSENTDVGARILAHSAKQYITDIKISFMKMFNRETDNGKYLLNIYHQLGERVIHKALNLLLPFDLNDTCIDATLIISFCIDNVVYTYLYGDGFIVYGNKEKLMHNAIRFESSAPFYLNYLLNTKRYEDYHDCYGITKTMEYRNYTDESKTTKSPMNNNNSHFVTKINMKEFNFVLISSDGIESCIDDHRGKAVELKDVISKITAFKDYDGEFIVRRMKRYFKKLPSFIYHRDDVSIGGFHYTPED